jgi:hypothetical protein
MKRLVDNVDASDAALAALGLAGVPLFAWVLPRRHPDAAAGFSLEPGDVLDFYTDGITEAMNPAHEQYGAERLVRCLSRVNGGPARTTLQAVADDVDRFIEPAERRDDMTMVVAKYEGAPTSDRDGASRRAASASVGRET